MENRKVGYLLFGISAVIVLIIYLFNSALKEIINSSCTMAGHDSCIMSETLKQQTYLSIGITAIIAIIALVLIFSKPDKRIIVKKVKEKIPKKELDLSGLRKEDKQVLKIIQDNNAIFQADLTERSGFGKAKVSRILDRLENRGIIERKRRGMTNVVVMKN